MYFNKPRTNKRVEDAKRRFMECYDYILDVYDAGDFVEIVGRVGGDTVTLRYYNNGDVFER